MRDLYTEVSARIVAELEGDAARHLGSSLGESATAGQNVPQNAVDQSCLKRMQRHPAVAST